MLANSKIHGRFPILKLTDSSPLSVFYLVNYQLEEYMIDLKTERNKKEESIISSFLFHGNLPYFPLILSILYFSYHAEWSRVHLALKYIIRKSKISVSLLANMLCKSFCSLAACLRRSICSVFCSSTKMSELDFWHVAGSELALENSFCYSGAEPTHKVEKMIPRGMASLTTVSLNEENYTEFFSFFPVFKTVPYITPWCL